MRDAHEMLGHDRQPAGRKQEMDVGHAAVLAVLDRDHCTARRAAFDRGQRIFETEARQRQRFGRELHRGLVRIGSGGAAERDRPRRVGGRGRAHRIDKGEGRFGELAHCLRALRSRSRGIKRYCGLHPCERRRCALERRATI